MHADRKAGDILGTSISSQTRKISKVTTVIIEIPTNTPTSAPHPTLTPKPITPTKPEIKDVTTPTPNTTATNSNSQYIAEKIGDSTYRVTNVVTDSQMATPREIFDALNNYRHSHGKTALSWDDPLSNLAQERANLFASNNNLDSHTGFRSFMDNDGFSKIGFNSLGENSALLSGNMKGERIIKEIFGADSDHDNNQLEASWEYVGVGVKDKAINVNFGKNKR